MGLNADITAFLRDAVPQLPDNPDHRIINRVLRVMGRWRQALILEVYLREQGPVIWSGPFKGMEYQTAATEGAVLPRLLGVYESELHSHLLAFAAEDLDCVIDVGCAEGYYAVGLARLMPTATIYAHDINEKALAACRELAAKNGVGERVIVGGVFQPTDFEAFAGRKALVMVDAEGAELDVLRPDLSPALAGLNVIVETHDLFKPGILDELVRRFTPTHDVVRVDQQYPAFQPPPWFRDLPHLDRLLAIWEWRASATPWLVMRPKRSG
jgi:SAM-dependent methyltransferase